MTQEGGPDSLWGLCNIAIISPPISAPESDDEMWATYFKEVDKTDGFDVPMFPNVCPGFHQIIRMDLSRKNYADTCEMYSKLAIEKYNEKLKGTQGELEFVEVSKGMIKASSGFMYYLTFNAKNIAKGGREYTYQAVVLDGIKEVEVLSFRPKPGQEEGKNKWFWQGHLCCPQIED